MASNSDNSDKILKTFSNIRCLNRDQLPRYLDGRLTEVEKHLVEQHLVDCDLCYDALQVLEQPQHREKYQPLSVSIQQYIRNSIRQVSQVHKAERYQRKEQKKESLLIYFWVVAGIALAAGVIYLVQQDNRFRSSSPKTLASNAMPTIQAANRQEVDQPVGGPATPPPARKDTLAATPTIATPAPTAVPVPVVKKDSVAAAPKPKPVVKTDSVAKKPAPPAPAEEKKPAPPVEKEKEKEKDAPVVAKKEEPKPAPKEKEKDKDDDDKKPSAPATSGTDEFLYKAAMVYHQQGDLNEAISRYKHLSSSSSRYGELARYQLAVCYRSKGQTGKARRMFKEVVNMGGSMKDKAQAALDNL